MGQTRTLAMVVAHPDDDAYGLAGTVALHAADPAFRYVLIHATDGEGGDIRKGFPATPETLGAIRRAECDAAWRAHGRVPDRHEWFGYPDGAVDRVPFVELVDRIADILEEEEPDVVGTFGPDGITGHPDHIRVGAATDAAFLRFAGKGRAGFKRLVHGALPDSVFERWNAKRASKGMTMFDPNRVYDLRGVPDEQIGVAVDCSSVADRIVAGLLEHQSQLHVIKNEGADLAGWKKSVGREYTVIAWPPRSASTPILADVFQDLD